MAKSKAKVKVDYDFIQFETNNGSLIAAFKPASEQIWKEDSTTERIRPEKLMPRESVRLR